MLFNLLNADRLYRWESAGRNGFLLMFTVFLLTGATGCVQKTKNMEVPVQNVDWSLTEEGSRIYNYLLFETSRADGEEQISREAIESLLAMDGDIEIIYEAAAFYRRQGDLVRTREVLKHGLERHPGELQLSLLLSDTYLTEKRVDDAVLTMQDFLQANSDSVDAIRELSALLIQYERHQEALDILDRLEPAQVTPLFLYFKAKAYSGLGSTKKAQEALRAAVEKDPEMLEAWAELAYLQEMDKDFLAAEETYTRLLELGEDRPEIWLRLIDINLQLNRPDKALSLVRHAPQSNIFLLQASSSFLDQEFFEEAREVLGMVAEQESPPVDLFFHQAILAYEADKDQKKAIELLEKVPPEHPYYDRSLRFRASMLYDLGEKEAALKLIAEGKERFPDDQSFYEMEAGFFQEEKNYEKAVGLLGEAIAKWPESVDLLYAQGLLLDEMNRTGEALELMENVLLRDPEHADAMNYIGYTLTQQERDLDRALALIRTALNIKPESGYILDSLAWVHFKRGELQEAWEAIRTALEMTGDDATIWEHYGDIAQALGNTTEASEAYAKALELGPEDSKKLEEKLQSL